MGFSNRRGCADHGFGISGCDLRRLDQRRARSAITFSRLSARHGGKPLGTRCGHRWQPDSERSGENVRYGVNALARFDRDVLAQAGVKYVIVLEGIDRNSVDRRCRDSFYTAGGRGAFFFNCARAMGESTQRSRLRYQYRVARRLHGRLCVPVNYHAKATRNGL